MSRHFGLTARPGYLSLAALLMALSTGVLPLRAQAADAVAQLLDSYRQQGVQSFSAEAGATFWQQSFDGRSCTRCHGADPTRSGVHQRTRKPIEPMAPSVNPTRLTDVSTINKWFLRNCKWTLQRECTAQEKGNVLVWLQDR